MKPVMQTKLGVGGDCFLACLASLLEIPIETIPEFQNMDAWHTPLISFIESHGCEFYGSAYGRDIKTYSPGIDGYYIVTGGSPRGLARGHSVIYRNGVMVHDPHPSGDGITSESSAYMIERKASA